MEVFGWIILILFGLIGFGVIVYPLCEFLVVQIRVYHAKIAKELEVMREDINARGDLKRERLAKKRERKNKIAHKKLDMKLDSLQEKVDGKNPEKREEKPSPKQEEKFAPKNRPGFIPAIKVDELAGEKEEERHIIGTPYHTKHQEHKEPDVQVEAISEDENQDENENN